MESEYPCRKYIRFCFAVQSRRRDFSSKHKRKNEREPEKPSLQVLSFVPDSLGLQKVNVFAVFPGDMDNATVEGDEDEAILYSLTEQVGICDLFVTM